MITSVAMITVRPGHESQVIDVLNNYVTKEKDVKGCMRVYYKRALDTGDTFLVYAEYDTLEHFRTAEKTSQPAPPEGGKIQFMLKPHILKAFFGNFD
jgi:heme-degrading monooxygenase HmoA